MNEGTQSAGNGTFPRKCALCGREYERMEGIVGDLDLCHPFDAPDSMTCYHRWTVYGVRSKVPDLMAALEASLARAKSLLFPKDDDV